VKKVALSVTLKAKPGKEEEVAAFLCRSRAPALFLQEPFEDAGQDLDDLVDLGS
jgi:hypothetical protein